MNLIQKQQLDQAFLAKLFFSPLQYPTDSFCFCRLQKKESLKVILSGSFSLKISDVNVGTDGKMLNRITER